MVDEGGGVFDGVAQKIVRDLFNFCFIGLNFGNVRQRFHDDGRHQFALIRVKRSHGWVLEKFRQAPD